MKPAGCLVVLLAFLPSPVRADGGDIGTLGAEEAAGLARINGIAREVQKLGDWDTMYQQMAPGIDAFWAQQGWNDEADHFALETLHEVAAVPPWELHNRINRLLGAVRGRYGLTEEQYLELQSRTYGFIGALAWRHGRTLYRQTKEAVDTRLRGEPFTPAQVARWTQDSRDVLDDARAQVERVSGEFARTFTPEQRAIYERDMASYHRRMAAVDDLRRRWAAGQWRPEDWGLQNDPVYRAAAEVQASPPPDPGELAIDPLDESAWARYVRHFVRCYDLDDAQATAAWSILEEMEGRAAYYRRLHRDQLARIANDQRAAAAAQGPIGELFDELKRRLRPIPNSAQRLQVRSRPPAEDAPPSPSPAPPRRPARTNPIDRVPPE